MTNTGSLQQFMSGRGGNVYSRRDFIQRIAVIGAVAPMRSAVWAKAPASIDLFTQIARTIVSDATETILTRGWQLPGIGAARYVFDENVDQEWVERYPRSAVLSANSRGFRLATLGGDVRQYGALGDGTADDTAAINEALSQGGDVALAGPAIYNVTDRLLLSVPRTRMLLGRAVILRTQSWRYKGSQHPFGNAIHITADDCEVIGSGPTSIIENVDSDANGVGFLHCGGGKVAQLVLKGGKRGLSAIRDDTFQSAISIINDRSSSARGRRSETLIEDCWITDWMQYGINIYGSLAADIVVRRNNIVRMGTADDRESVGAGVVLTRGVGPVLIDANTISGNKGHGVFISSAGVEVHDIMISHNQIVRNGLDGVHCSEQSQFGSSGAVGQRRVTISDNRIEENGGTGVRVGTYDGVGSIHQILMLRNSIENNKGSGIMLQANAAPGRDVSATIEGNRLIANGDYGVAVGPNLISLRHKSNVFERNRHGESVDHRGGGPRQLAER